MQVDQDTATAHKGGFFGFWTRTPLYLRIVIALALGLVTGLVFGPQVAWMREVSSMVLALLRALATPLILLAILHALLRTNLGGGMARRMGGYLLTNTLAAIIIGLTVANVVQPGRWAGNTLGAPSATEVTAAAEKKPYDPVEDIKNKIPTNIIKPLYDDNIIAVIILGILFGLALRQVREAQLKEDNTAYKSVENFIETTFTAVMTALHWIIQLVPIAVYCIVSSVIGKEGFLPFQHLLGFIVAVLLALALQMTYYLMRIKFGSWVTPGRLLSGGREALLTAFSTASSTITMPITYNALRNKDKVGLRDESASLGALVGSNFNNDGTALYEAMAPLFIAQATGQPLAFTQQIIVVFMAVIASVGAAGIPEAGLVTMLLVFKSVNLDTAYVLLLLPVDWFLDRCRTAINVMGDMTVSCLLDGHTPEAPSDVTSEEASELRVIRD